MTAPPSFIDFVEEVVDSLRDITPRPSVQLGVLHGFCLDAAQEKRKKIGDFLTSPGGLTALSAALGQMPDKVLQADIEGKAWKFVRERSPGEPGEG